MQAWSMIFIFPDDKQPFQESAVGYASHTYLELSIRMKSITWLHSSHSNERQVVAITWYSHVILKTFIGIVHRSTFQTFLSFLCLPNWEV